MFSRYLLNVGTPFEVWLQHLAESAQQEQTPYAFMQRATTYLLEMPWIAGLKWVSDEGQDTVGEVSPNSIEVADQDLHLTLYCRHNIPPLMRLHIQLLIQLLGHFYHAKQRELRLSEIARLQTIYETGSRLTHDLKNMLQSLFALTSVAQHQSEKSQPILQRQLPVLSRRIELLLTKLKYPEREANEPELPLTVWWEDIRQRHQHQNIEWLSEGAMGDQVIPVTLFDSIADNLIDNACNKRLREPGIHIRVSLRSSQLVLRIEDDGSAIPDYIARKLLSAVVPSEDGLGIGLYQAARWAAQSGFHLAMSENQTGKVVFELS
jgi:signal transduction histidine kinase